ncbi:MAG: maleate cis-trans isomerase [Deltaproteobacteria bacterium]|nr:maleate cis-trans isomerase [Deltaproteobacteria bacterium]
MLGWRARIGLLIPSPNSVMESEFFRMCPEGISVHTARMRFQELTPEGFNAMDKGVEEGARQVADVGARVIVYGCTAGSFIKGLGWDQALAGKMEAATGRKAITTSTAVVEALKALGVKRMNLATPYPDDINQEERRFFESNGFEVVSVRGLGIRQPEVHYPLNPFPILGIGTLEPYVAFNIGRDAHTPDSDAVFISCTDFRTLEIIDPLEADLGKPVISSNLASMYGAMRILRIPPGPGCPGTLMRSFSEELKIK